MIILDPDSNPDPKPDPKQICNNSLTFRPKKVISDKYISTFSRINLKFMREEGGRREEGGKRAGGGREEGWRRPGRGQEE